MLTVYTRSFNDELYAMMKSFIPDFIPCKRLTGFDRWEDARTFIERVIAECDDFAAIIDEDCFIYRFDSIIKIEQHMRANGFTHAGVPDYGVIPHRNFNWTTINPFFNVLDCLALRSVGALDPIDKPNFVLSKPGDEPFTDFYIHLYKIGNPLWLNAETLPDGITSNVMDYEDNFFALHSWYAREFDKEDHRKRIIDVYERATKLFGANGLYCALS